MEDAFSAALARAGSAVGGAVVEELRKRGFDALYAATKEQALAAVLDLIPAGASVGVPGSVTVREIGAMEALRARGCRVIQHWGDMSSQARAQARLDENAADFFLTSANALTQAGEIISIDGMGNRVAAMTWGQGELIFVIGLNKLASALEDGIRRARSAVIPNALRLGEETPCTKAGRCVDCHTPSRACRAMLILEAPPRGRAVHVIIVGEGLGY